MAWWKREVLSISRRYPVSCIPSFGSVNVLYQETELLECCFHCYSKRYKS